MNPDHGFFIEVPQALEAYHWKGGPADALDVIGWITRSGGTARYHDYEDGVEAIWLDHGGDVDMASPGDWIICAADGQHYAVAADKFERAYQRA